MRIFNTAIAALLVAALSIVYGLKEQTKELEREAAKLSAKEAELRREIARLKFEWSYATSPDRLARLAAAMFGPRGPEDPSGAPLVAWAVEQSVRLKRPGAPEKARPRAAPASLPPIAGVEALGDYATGTVETPKNGEAQ